MTPFRHLPINRKIRLVVVATSTATLLAAIVTVFAVQLAASRGMFARDLEAVTEIIAHNSVGALAFGDRKAANEVLAALTRIPSVLHAEIHARDGASFARFDRLGAQASELVAGSHGTVMARDHPIVVDGEPIGRLHVLADYRGAYRALFWRHTQIFAVVLVLSVVLAVVVSAPLQRLISEPILRLARTAGQIATGRDYGLRAAVVGHDEIGQLTEAFNRMLDEITQRDRALSASEQRLELALSGAEAGLWDLDVATGRLAVNRRAAEMLGRAPGALLPTLRAWLRLVHRDDLPAFLERVRAHAAGRTPILESEHRMRDASGAWHWVLARGRIVERDPAGRPRRAAGTQVDITARKAAEAELHQLQQRLLETSRLAGMAEVATGVLHNVGNVLNSINVSTTLLGDRVRASKIDSVARVAQLLAAHAADLGQFLEQDPKGRLVPSYLTTLGEALAAEHAALLSELDLLGKHVEHVKRIVAMQQSYARVAGVVETVPVTSLVEDALALNAGAFARHGVRVLREFADVPPVSVDRHRVMQILINLLRNAKYALDEGAPADKRLTVRVCAADAGRVRIEVADNGVGIPAENLTRIFMHGFTTRRDGHGFGLHSGALAAQDLGGTLTAQSGGPGQGSTFTLELPTARSGKGEPR